MPESDSRAPHKAQELAIRFLKATPGATASQCLQWLQAQGVRDLPKANTVSAWIKRHVDRDVRDAPPPAVWMALEDLELWDRNPRDNDPAVPKVAASIARFGFQGVLTGWLGNGVVYAGNTRTKAVLHLQGNVPLWDGAGHLTGWRERTEEDGPFQAPGSPKPGTVPVRWAGLEEWPSEQEAIAFAVADNYLGELATWRLDGDGPDNLSSILQGLDNAGVPLDTVWTDQDELYDILDQEPMPGVGGTDPGAGEGDGEGSDDEDDEDDEADALPEEVPAITQEGEVVQLGRHTLHCASCIDVANAMDENSVDAIVGDAPYGLSPDGRARTWDEIADLRAEGKGPKGGFMGKEWDAGVPGLEWAQSMFRVLKPGGHMVMFCGTRTQHRMVTALEDAGFEVRDVIHWLQYQGFPKSLDISKAIDKAAGETGQSHYTGANHKNQVYGAGMGGGQTTAPYEPATDDTKRWNGWGTALKPAIEPAVLVRKPLGEDTVAANVLKWGTGGLNIDGCRIPAGDPAWPGESNSLTDAGRFPANVYACPKPAGAERGEANSHPTVKPIRLMRWLTRLVTPPGGTVYNPFGGSGTDLLAAEMEGFTSIATEMEPAYCDIIRARFKGWVEREDE